MWPWFGWKSQVLHLITANAKDVYQPFGFLILLTILAMEFKPLAFEVQRGELEVTDC